VVCAAESGTWCSHWLYPFLLHGLYDCGSLLLEPSDFPDVPDEPNLADLNALGPILALLLLLASNGLVELIWGGRIVYGLRKGGEVDKQRRHAPHAVGVASRCGKELLAVACETMSRMFRVVD
jgi:hypothetical protein